MKSVTILVPVYGVEKYIRECAESLFSQTYEDIHYVFCNDCTPDRSMDILAEVISQHPGRRVTILTNDTNKGIGATRQRLVESVDTDCFCFCDSDDILPRNAISIMVSRMEDTDKDIIEGAYQEATSESIRSRVFTTYHGNDDRYLTRILCQNLESNRIWGKLYKTELITKMDSFFFDSIDYCEDYCLMARLSTIASRAWTDEVVYYYRVDNASSYTKNISEKNLMSYLRANGRVLSFFHKKGHLPFALEIGILNAYRECRRNGIDMERADEEIRYVPQHLRAQMLYGMLHSTSFPLAVADYIYRLFRSLTA